MTLAEKLHDTLGLNKHQIEYILREVNEECSNLWGKVQYLVDEMDRIYDSDEGKYLEDHCFTFPDGETWYATGHEPQVSHEVKP